MLKKNKGQVSMFIVIGIILIIVALFLFFNGKVEIWENHDTKMKNQISQVVKDCIYDYTEEGAFILGFQGGYIEIPKEIENNPFRYTDFGMKIPNWDTKNDNIPTIASMQKELNNYIENQSYSCIMHNLKSMEENAFDISYDDRENFVVETEINNENIIVKSNYLIKFNEKNSEDIITIADYVVNLDNLRLGDLYNLAVEIYNVEGNTHLFEELTLDQIHSANDYSSKESMPSEGIDLKCGKTFWTIPQLKKNLANLNNNNFKYLEFVGTYPKEDLLTANVNNDELTLRYQKYYDNFYTHYLYNPKESFKNYNVEVVMPSTEITSKTSYIQKYPFREFKVSPSSGQLVESQLIEVDMGVKMPIPCIQTYHHIYTLDYDLIVKLVDYNEDGDKFFFQFPVRVEIHNNAAKEVPFSFLKAEEPTVTNSNYCNSTSKQYPLRVVAQGDRGKTISNVNISYKCVNLKCDMGTTQKGTFMGMENPGSSSRLDADFPFCIGGTVVGEKEGYHIAKAKVTTDESLFGRETYIGNNLVELDMIPTKSFDINLKSFLLKSKETGKGDRIEAINDGSIYVNLENVGYEFESTAIWPNEEGFLDELVFLDLDDVMYNLSVFYVDNDGALKGMYDLKNWTPSIHSGNSITFKLPVTDVEITEDKYLEFFEYMQERTEDPNYGIFFD